MRAAYDRRRASVVAFDAPEWDPPELVVLDTNVVAEALLVHEPEHAACDALVQRLGACGTVVVFNRLLEVELWEVLVDRALRAVMPRKRVRHARFAREGRSTARSALDHGISEWRRSLEALDWQRVELHEVADAVPDLMRSYGLQSYDAVHAATLLASGATDIVTRDAGFAALLPEDATVHTTRARLARTRHRRAGAG